MKLARARARACDPELLGRAAALLGVSALAVACAERTVGPAVNVALPVAPPPVEVAAPAPPPTASASASAAVAAPPATDALWREPTRSPRLAPPANPLDAPLHAICGDNDLALQRAAAIELERSGAGLPLLPSDELNFTLRALGDPHVWARGWSYSAASFDENEIAQRLTRFAVDGWNAAGTRRCGIARGHGAQGESIVAAVAIDALADLSPLPTTAKVGETLTVQGSLLVSVSSVTSAILGPRGAPKRVPVTLTGGSLALSFAPDQPGAWTIQIKANLQGGSRPVLEALVYVGATPPREYVSSAAPGEDAGAGVADPTESLSRMIAAARKAEGLPPLRRDHTLDSLARAHTDQMVRTRRVAHDVGSGEAPARLASAGIKTGFTGETVARAADVATVHRAIWGSANERGHLLDPKSKRLGLAVVVDEAGAWVTELFTE